MSAYAAPAFVAALFYYPIAAFLVPNLQFKSKALDVKYAPSFVVAVFQGKLLLAGLATESSCLHGCARRANRP